MAYGSTDVIQELEADNRRLEKENKELKAEVADLKATLKFVRRAAEVAEAAKPTTPVRSRRGA